MSGNKTGGAKAAETIKKRHGKDFYARIGAIGGSNGNTGGFAANHDLARKAGRIGGSRSRRGKAVSKPLTIEEAASQVDFTLSA